MRLLWKERPDVARQAVSVTVPHIVVRSLRDIDEMNIGVELQRRIWGYSETEIIPDQMFVVARESGGQVLAAFHKNQPVGFALAFAGTHSGKVHLHSHMVGVVREYQDRGVGRLLKLAQGEDAISRGIEQIEWTFDPLQLKNAHFNLTKLGAIVRRYVPNVYGRTSSPLHSGLPTDRLVAEWRLKSPHVQRVLAGKQNVVRATALRVSIPSTIRHICVEDPTRAEQMQTDLRVQFTKHLAAGCAAVGFELTSEQGSYLLELYEDRIHQTT